jgi:HK97 family phage major capsid protein
MPHIRHPVAVKSETDDTFTLEGWAVVYGGEDLTGEYFTADTDFWTDDKRLGDRKVYLYDHGTNADLKSQVIGSATLAARPEGIWYEAEVQKSAKYADQLRALADAGVLGTSTGAVSHLVQRQTAKSGATWLSVWPIAEVSATVTPAEPRTLGVEAIRSLVEHAEALKTVLPVEDAIKADTAVAELPAAFAFVNQHGDGVLPLTDAGHTRAAMARFAQIEFPSTARRREAWRRILTAADQFGIDVSDPAMPKTPENAGNTESAESAIVAEPEPTETTGDTTTESATEAPTKTYPTIQITEAHEPAPITGDEADMPLDKETLDALVEGVSTAVNAKHAPQFDAISKILERFENEPALKSAGHITVDGGTADKNVKSFADYLMAVKRDDQKRLTSVYNTKAVAQSEDSGTVGGYLVPTEYVARLMAVAGEDAVVRPRAYIQPMVAREQEIPALDQQTAPTAGNTSFYGGVQAIWTAEGGTFTKENANFKLIRLVAHKLAGYTLASNELQADSATALESLLMKLFGGAIGWYEDSAFLSGDGVAKPLGVTQAPGTISVTRSAGGNDFDPADIGAMLKRLLPTSTRKAVWVMHPYLLPSLLALSVGTSGFQTWVNNLRDAAPMTLLGLPVIFSEKMATAGTAGDVLLADFSYYVIGDRQSINIASSEHYAFLSGQTVWKFEERVDGQPWMKSAITLSDASSTVSPFVLLS